MRDYYVSPYLTSQNDVIVVRTDIACAIGVYESMLLNQIQYWIDRCQDEEHFKDGKYWIYQTYEGWQKQLPFLSLRTVKNIVRSLKKQGIIETGQFNKKNWDRTIWYTINYEKLDEIMHKYRECKSCTIDSENPALSLVQTMPTQECKPCTTNTIDYTETTSKTTSEKTISIEHLPPNAPLISDLDDYMIHVEKALDTDANDEICIAIRWFFEKYEDFTGHPHIMLKLSTVKDIADELVPYSDHLKEMMIWYYKKKASINCCGLSHFASEKMLAIIACETVGPGPVQNRWCLVN